MAGKMKATEEQIAYAKILDIGMKIGLLMLIVTFIVYILGLLSPHIPVNDLPKYWGLSVHKYLERTGIHPGWAWLSMIGRGDFLNFIGIAFLAGITVICYVAIFPIFMRKKDMAYSVFALIEVLVLVLAASGILRAGGH